MSTKLSTLTEDNSYKESNIQVQIQIHADNSITSDHLESQGKILKLNFIKYGIKHNITTL